MQKIKNTFWLKGLAWLLAAMFLFTMISRAADSFTVAKVSVSSPSARRIQYTISAQGRAEKNLEISVVTQPDILVRSVLVNVGQRVEKGDVLAVLDLNHLKEQMDSICGEKKALELQNQALEQNRQQEQKTKNRALSRAKSDYARLRQKNSTEIKKAQAALEKTREAYKKERKSLQKAQAALKKASSKPENERERLRQQMEKKRTAAASLQTATSNRRKSLAELKKGAKAEEKTAKRAVEDAMTAPAADHTADINDISIQKLNRQISKLTALKKAKGIIAAPESGVITSVLTGVGQKTPDTAAFVMTDESAGLKFVGQISPKDASHLSAGDEITLKSAVEELDVPITSMETDDNKDFINVSALLPADSFSLGETISMTLVQESENYSCTLPLTAIYDDSGKKYVLGVETENTVLGKQYVARKIAVKVLEKNNTYAALEAEGIKEDSKIITDTDSFVKPGDRIRLKEDKEKQR